MRTPTPPIDGDAKKPGKAKRLAIGGVGALVVFVAGGRLAGGGGPTKTVVRIVNTTTTLPDGKVVVLDPITMNLRDGRILKVGFGLQFEYEPVDKATEEVPVETVDGADSTKGLAAELDLAIEEFGRFTMEQLLGSGRNVAKEKLLKRLRARAGNKIEDVYFYQFVMQ